MTRRRYLDWLRGVAVLIMIEAHTLDSWALVTERSRPVYRWAMMLGGIGAPIFLFLAGITMALAAAGRLSRGMAPEAVAAMARRRGWQIFGLALLFRLQSNLISGGGLAALLKVDILNIMGVSMLIGAVAWGIGRDARGRALLLTLLAVSMAMLTPPVRATPFLAWVPDPIEWYLRSAPGHTAFTLFPWAGFFFAGGAVGLWMAAVRDEAAERRAQVWFAVLGASVACAGYASSLLPPLYAGTTFWSGSPTFFFVRLGILILTLPVAYVWILLSTRVADTTAPGLVQRIGISSFFIYWVHVEMVYGVPSLFLHKSLTVEQAVLGMTVLGAVLCGLMAVKERVVRTAAFAAWTAGVRGWFSIRPSDRVRNRGAGEMQKFVPPL